MPATALVVTSITSALTASTTATLVAVTSNASHTVGQYVIAGGEAMQIQSKIGTTQITVQRGMLGTRARLHAAGEQIYGSTSTLGPTTYNPFAGEQRVTLPDAPPVGLPLYQAPLGARCRDAAGNEYVLVDFLTPVFPQQPVMIHSGGMYIADAIGVTGRGPLGVVAETGACTSDQWGWVQIYGRCIVQLGGIGSSPSDAANGPTTLNTSVATKFFLPTSTCAPTGVLWTSDVSNGSAGFYISGMKVAVDASPADVSATTSGANGGHQGTSIAVWLNYPEVTYVDGGMGTST